MKSIIVLLMLCSCLHNPVPGIGDTYYRSGGIAQVTHYSLTVTRHTPSGVAVDDPKNEIGDAVIDANFAAVEACLATMPRALTADQSSVYSPGMNCAGQAPTRIPASIDRTSLLVKVAPDWIQGHTEQLFPCNIDDSGCIAKGLKPSTPDNPCMCRHAVQAKSALIITPNAKLLPAAIVEAATSCGNPLVNVLAKCAAPL